MQKFGDCWLHFLSKASSMLKSIYSLSSAASPKENILSKVCDMQKEPRIVILFFFLELFIGKNYKGHNKY